MIPRRWFRWTRANELKLIELWPKHSASEIGAMLNCTRNAVIGKAHRLDLCGEKARPVKQPTQPKQPKTLSDHPEAVKTRRLREAHRASGRLPPLKPRPVKEDKRGEALERVAPDFGFPESRRFSIDQLERSHCRFPLGHPGEEGFCYCAADRESDAPLRPYCAGHSAIAYRPVPSLTPREIARIAR